ncbi:Gamma-glutamylputrescine oxidoreductase [Methyloligella halotolerans]|uniref:Gamma-glutamylputrescine oxidoreductase n=1 Tax=Methyloligella halotolerans TaxID=1177755 RepID=A0A1E2RWY7_9HYPH|nr:FAD-binding oxidoreductase [Methyloligella halotolerans]ODA66747.1 Gamma-glutamylputrescine oxidoreductase [Methyloligella halotolerans]
MDILTINDRPGEYPASYYAATATPPGPYPEAEGEIAADVCVVGGGFTGLSAALHLAEQGMDVVLLEASRVGFGASGRNGGQLSGGQRVEQPELEKEFGLEKAKILWQIGQDSVALVKGLIERGNIDCALTPGIIHADHRARFTADTKAYVEHMRDVYGDEDISFLDKDEIRDQVGSPDYHSGSLNMGSAHLHPLRYVFGLARMAEAAGVRIFERSRMTGFDKGETVKLRTGKAVVSAKHMVLGLNGYHNNIEGGIAAKVMPINNYIAVTEPLGENFAKSLIKNGYAVADSRFVVNYFRLTEDRRMLFGGGETYNYRFPDDIAATVRKPMLEIFPQLKDVPIDYAWGGTLAITRSRLPHFHRVDRNILSTSGFSGHGIGMATMAGKIAADAIANQAGRFDIMSEIPNASFPGGSAMRLPLLAAAMTWYSFRDKL